MCSIIKFVDNIDNNNYDKIALINIQLLIYSYENGEITSGRKVIILHPIEVRRALQFHVPIGALIIIIIIINSDCIII